jgi:hypothetical protein
MDGFAVFVPPKRVAEITPEIRPDAVRIHAQRRQFGEGVFWSALNYLFVCHELFDSIKVICLSA